MRCTLEGLLRRWAPAALGLALLCPLAGSPTYAAGAPPTRVRFQLRSECTCAACGFALQAQLRKLPGVTRVELSPRERVVAVSFGEEQVTLSRVAATVAGSELGKRSALIGDLADTRRVPDAAALARVDGVRAVEVDARKGRLLVELTDGVSVTTAELTAALAKSGAAVRFDTPAHKR